MGTESTVLIVGRGKRVLWDCASDGLLGWGFAALAASVASYGLDTLRQSLDEMTLISEDDLAEDGSDAPVEERYGELTGFVYADLPALIDRALNVAGSRGQVAIGMEEATWGLDRRLPRFPVAGLVGLLATRLIAQEIPDELPEQMSLNLSTGTLSGGFGYPFVVDLDAGTLTALDFDEDGEHLYRLDLARIEGLPADRLRRHLRKVFDDPSSQPANDDSPAKALSSYHDRVQAQLDALAVDGAELPDEAPQHWTLSKHYVWQIGWRISEGYDYERPLTAHIRAATEDNALQVIESVRALVRMGVAPPALMDGLIHIPGAPGEPHWLALEAVPLTKKILYRMTPFFGALVYTDGIEVLSEEAPPFEGVDSLEKPAFIAAWNAIQRPAEPIDWEPSYLSFMDGVKRASYGLDAEFWADIPENPSDEVEFDEETWNGLVEAAADALILGLRHLTPAAHTHAGNFVAQVRDHGMFQAAVAARPPLRAMVDYLTRHPEEEPARVRG